ncbi:MAG: DUF5615 family PIN-like protein [Chloroflexota bacterium]
MSLPLYLDDSAASRLLAHLSRAAGHHVVIPADVGLDRARDADHFAYDRQHGLALVTKNPADFKRLAAAAPNHGGLLLVYRDNDRTRDMTDADIVQAIANLLAAGLPIAGQVHVLNHWRY